MSDDSFKVGKKVQHRQNPNIIVRITELGGDSFFYGELYRHQLQSWNYTSRWIYTCFEPLSEANEFMLKMME